MSMLSAVRAHPLPMPHVTHFHPIDAARAMFHGRTDPEQLHYAPDLSFLEDAAMAREMLRL